MSPKKRDASYLLKPEMILWGIILLYICLIYSTVSIVPQIRIALTEIFGVSVFNLVYLALALGAGWAFSALNHNFTGKRLKFRISALVAILGISALYLSKLPYAVEKIHFVQYGILGILLVSALSMRIQNSIVTYVASVLLVYIIGLGDETFQDLISSRVGEIRDNFTNIFSAILGLALHACVAEKYSIHRISRSQWKLLLMLFAVSVVCTAAFLQFVHGFGTVQVSGNGRFYASLSPEQMIRINRGDSVPVKMMKIYENEAKRHLFQREFYLTNDFKGQDGNYYRDYTKSAGELRVLENFYSKFLNDNSLRKSSEFILDVDKAVADKAGDVTVVWSDSLRNQIFAFGGQDPHFTSRVKSTVITSFSSETMWLFSVIILVALGGSWFVSGLKIRVNTQSGAKKTGQ